MMELDKDMMELNEDTRELDKDMMELDKDTRELRQRYDRARQTRDASSNRHGKSGEVVDTSPPDKPAPRTWTERMDSSDMEETKGSRSDSLSGKRDCRFGETERRGGDVGRVGDAGSDGGRLSSCKRGTLAVRSKGSLLPCTCDIRPSRPDTPFGQACA